MSRLIAIIVGLILVLVAVIVAVPMLIPMETYKNQVIATVKQQTGRDLRIDGDIGLSFFPNIAVSLENVGFSNASWAREPEMASMKEMRAALKLMPLFSGNIEIDSFSLVDPVIHLEVRRDGTPNWQFEAAQAAAPESSAATEDGGGSSLGGVRLGDVSVRNGTATYRNAQTGASYAAERVNMDLALPGLDDPFIANGSLVWNGDEIGIDLRADRPRALTEGGETPVALTISAPKVDASYSGTVKPLDGLAFAGEVDLNVPSVRELAAWSGSPLPAGDGFGALSVEGKASGGGNEYRFSDARVGFDGMNATGNLIFRTGGARPYVKGNLAVDKIDVNTYLAEGKSGGGGGGGGDAGGSAGGADWSTEPIDMSGLKAIDADFAFSTQQILFQKITIGESVLNLKLANGVLTANLTQLDLYEGRGSGVLTLNGAGNTPQLKADFRLSGVAAEPLLTDAADFSRLQGTTAVNFSLATSGRSQRDMVAALGGNGAVKFTNGKIKGVNLAQLTRTVLSAATSGWQAGGTQDTDFSELGGTFTISNGVLSNNDLKLLSPLIRISGAGTANILEKTLNYRVEPKIAASLEGQGGKTDVAGIEVPIIISGPWAKPRFTPDLKSMIENRENIGNTIKSIKEDGGKSLLKGLMGEPGGGAPAEGADTGGSQEETKPSAEDALKQLFGR
ncbi:AsmA family protein [Parvibaculum lavamentivorans DS-1]|uniref:AsmA family protein n=1 Tax=Parvibaculum lavamentivorans (strain DS-1 / DSM 13023 / NCIMB 13966) TaxID=402881 RepID=A7HQJ2_PARL1|nr:AsmA family protein [Parvibaculum lavamentivorans]ABS62175.1 AsmA family protein [Parvibaculum lavamentivorans DS-1]